MKKMSIKKINSILVGDIETLVINNKQVPIAIGLYTGFDMKTMIINFETENMEIESERMMMNWIKTLVDSNTSKSTIYFHNLGNFDGLFLLKTLAKMENYETDFLIRENIIYEIIIKERSKIIKIRDSYLLIPLSLEESALLLNKNFLKEKFNFNEYDLTKYKNDKNAIQNLQKYIENDLRTLYELLNNFEKFIQETFPDIKREVILQKMTLYSLTQYIFLNHFYEHTFVTPWAKTDKILRNGYFGGLVDIYIPYGKNLVMLDFNSMYPHIMSESVFGINRPKEIALKDEYSDNLEKLCLNPGFVEVIIKCKSNLNKPLIAIKYKKKIVQPTGTFTALITTDELKYCLDHYKNYYEFFVMRIFSYETYNKVFKKFVNILYEKRKETQNPIYKKMMNSLYGRFGMVLDKTVKSRIVKADDCIEFTNKNIAIESKIQLDENTLIYSYKENDTGIEHIDTQKDDIEIKKFNVRVDWANMITARGRLKLQELKDKVKIYYIDTDAIVIEKQDRWKIKDHMETEGKELGKLKSVAEMEEAIFLAPKSYAYKDKENYHFVMKGVKRSDIKLNDTQLFDFFKEKLKKDNEVILRSDRKNEFSKNKKNFEINTEIEKLELSLEYDKREKIYNEEGIWVDTKPIEIEEE